MDLQFQKFHRLLSLFSKLPFWFGGIIEIIFIAFLLAENLHNITIPIPFLVLTGIVAFSGIQGGFKGGITSASIVSIFLIYSTTIHYGPETLTGNTLAMSLGIVVYFIIGSFIGYFRDIYDNMYHQTENINKILEMTVDERTRELKLANEALKKENEERKHQEEELKTINKYQSLVVEVEDLALRGMELQQFMDKLVGRVRDVYESDFCKILELHEGNHLFHLISGVGWDRVKLGSGVVESGRESQAGYTLISDDVVVVSDYPKETRFTKPKILKDHDVESGMSAVIRVNNVPYGVIGLHYTEPRDFHLHEINTFKVIANFLGTTIERNQKNMELLDREKKYRTLMDEAADGIFIADISGKYIDVNQAGLALTGYTYEELLSKNLTELLVPSEVKTEPIKYDELKSGKVIKTQRRLIRKDGSSFIAELHSKMLPNGTIQAIVRDQSQRLKAEKDRQELQYQLYQSQKMQTIGQLAGGIAHDFNNYLTTIIGFARLLESSLTNQEEKEMLQEVLNASQQSSRLVRQLLIFSRQEVINPDIVNINVNISNQKNLLQHLLGEDIKITLDLEDALENIKIDSNQFDQILLNLAVNAKDAMPNGGKIFIETYTVKKQRIDSNQNPNTKKDYICLKFQDFGTGMSEDVKLRIFEPFFTTKKIGTGLGLVIVKRIVDENQGIIQCDSELNIGTTFKIYFPIAPMEEPILDVEIANKTPIAKNGIKSILVVEDDENIRKLIVAGLHSKFDIHIEKTINDARKTIYDKELKFDAIITDVILPDGNGLELIKSIKDTYPNTKVLFITGYADIPLIEQIKEDYQILEKPFDIENLVEHINNLN